MLLAYSIKVGMNAGKRLYFEGTHEFRCTVLSTSLGKNVVIPNEKIGI